MTVKLDFEECLKDSPRFRAAIEVVEGDISDLETRLDKLVKQCHSMLEAGKVYCQNSRNFITGLMELGQHCSGDSVIAECLNKFSSKLSSILDAQAEVIETTQKSVKMKLQNFVKEDVKKFKDVKKEFERSSESLEAALAKNAQVPRGKQHEVEEAGQTLLNARKAFRSEALDYVLQINVIESKKKTDILMAMLSLMDAQAQFFQQGHQSLSELENYRRNLSEQHTHLVLNSAREKRDMEQRHAAIKTKDMSYDDSIMDFSPDAASGIAMEGYLYKRASNAFKTWSRRWFSIQKNQLVYQKKFKDQPTVVVEDLRLCTVKPCFDHERRFCFEVVSPSKSCLLQGDSERQQQGWISAVQNSIASAFQDHREDTHSPRGLERTRSVSAGSGMVSGEQPNAGHEALEEVQKITGNNQCCDCGELGPDWASINLGITLCIVCSGIHRSLGVHFSKVRSLTLDSWEPELIRLMCELGNTAINRIYEARIDEMTIKKPNPSSPRQEKESWIRSKYVEKKFIQKLPETGRSVPLRRSSARRDRANTQDRPVVRPTVKPKPNRATLPRLTGVNQSDLSQKNNTGIRKDDEEEDLSGLHPGALLYRSAALQNFPVMADALAHGADVNWVNAAEDSSTPLIQAVSANSLAASEFLLQNGANVNQADSNGRGPLHHATILGHTGLVCLFLKRGADYNARDKDQKDPITIAVENANADIVTLLRIAKMNKEMREMDGAFGQSGQSGGLGHMGGGGGGAGQPKKGFQALKNHLSGWALGGAE
ncbi:arf-GAP with coiled-coil, ANK repeat and PH domain-containing protein 1 isoform X1 [Scleropages formosus]|uniref:arf-GAP with coiled-coil, ANK repeat and PH domain-containing protein 1 isoform X1 n=1 Tax=Scleropages formosus TaxID=113540 RepID=UPI0010FA9D95|nr:arf-GAP with coiled-coil, ANK repeat and PH domain-containing protein 1 isoform X1 [Scleropages formosus]XP_029113280.1 arf-GAP with coiled-coil, ANK repeat and PH domain-containing protein 1 isoform X1 [Scleropages formosus]XP_029113281.1 arf-GAP with coiled-coil, ANK repeat and PH domain-containing protein 1 isoform X1 [Scleropages formosus]XP_029113282.1 arf-GAP with coiled-coil, ANK repeat and PH domain-containing protein 1 isoform X1 [Scleropages formosus]